MNFYGFVFAASNDAIESVSARVISECSSATYAIFDDLPITALDLSRILFIAKSEIRHEVEEAVVAVCNVYNTWCLNQVVKKNKNERFQRRAEWTPTAQSCTKAENGFVYIYRQWKSYDPLLDEAFYVGMSAVGDKSRDVEHIKETIKAVNKNQLLNNSKHNKIFKWLSNKNLISKVGEKLFEKYDASKHSLVNRIAEGITPIAAFAIENFLIFHYYGVYRLSNSTNGNSDLQKTRIYFISRPRVVSPGNSRKWNAAINEFLKIYGELKQTARFDLQLMALSDSSNFEQNLINQVYGILVPDELPRNIGVDVEWSWKFALGKGPQWVRFQLKFSAKHARVAINLRKSKDVKFLEFRLGISRIWSDPSFANNNTNNIYFKPYGIGGKPRTVDTWFSYDDLNEISRVAKGYPLTKFDVVGSNQAELDLTLPCAINRLAKLFTTEL